MELSDLESGLKCVASGGTVLNCQELTCMQASLHLLKCKEKYSDICFWGKIFGQTCDYYIAYGMKDSDFEFPSKSFYYAGEDFDFQPLPRLTEEVADQIIDLCVDEPFTGVAMKPLVAPADGEAQPLVELHRLAQVVQEIDFDTAVVPKGAYCLNEAHSVVSSSAFKGLGLTEATDLKKYAHFRPPTSVAGLRALAKTDVQFYSEFLDPLESDLPKSCWSVRQDKSISMVTLRSLNWPGYISYHIPGTVKFGGLYFGYGNKNRDLPFIL
eukprot:TRINITY_DN2256_c0_g1_i1.p1 TRINITY_DN2256_c0_g1~~TRINITY_DN2256_c0_g1_i1.p1  ORF type:complete len:269 (-),score=60.30 TRINITY_DN2256_c0_g1_i1:217-1023(-)